MARIRLVRGGRPAASCASRNGARTRASQRFHGRLAREADRRSVVISPSCASTHQRLSGIFVIVRNYPANRHDPQVRDGASDRAGGPSGDAQTVAIVVWDGVCAFELGVACDIFGDEWARMVGVPWYRSSVCGLTPGPVATDSGFQILPAHGL